MIRSARSLFLLKINCLFNIISLLGCVAMCFALSLWNYMVTLWPKLNSIVGHLTLVERSIVALLSFRDWLRIE